MYGTCVCMCLCGVCLCECVSIVCVWYVYGVCESVSVHVCMHVYVCVVCL